MVKQHITYSEWKAMRRFVVIADIKSKSEKKPFKRVLGPYETRAKAASARVTFKRQLETSEGIESFTIVTATLYDPDMFSGKWEISGE